MKLSITQQKIMREIEIFGEANCAHLYGRGITGWYRSVESLEQKGLVKRISTQRVMSPLEADHWEAIKMEHDRHQRQMIENRAAQKIGRKPKKIIVNC